jgi:anti-anti-sigma factor
MNHSISRVLKDDEILIRLGGEFKFPLRQAFLDSYKDVIGKPLRFVLDFSAVTEVDSSGLGMLLVLREKVLAGSKGIHLRGCDENVRKILHVTRLDEMFIVD